MPDLGSPAPESDAATSDLSPAAGRLRPVLLVALCVAAMWVYALLVYLPRYHETLAGMGYTFGPDFSDLYPSWRGAYARLWEGRDPYSAAVTADIQQGHYGRVLAPDDPVRDRQQDAYPLYSVFLFAPLTLLPFRAVQTAYYAAVPLLIGLSVLAWLRVLHRPPALRTRILLALLGASTVPVVQATLVQQPAALVAALQAAAALVLAGITPATSRATGRYLGAGVLLALAMLKPQLTVVLAIWLCGWALIQPRERGGLLVGFGGTMALLVGGAFLLQPNWLDEWRSVTDSYLAYTESLSILQAWLPPALIPVVLAALGLGLALYAWTTRRTGPGSPAFNLTWAGCGLYSILVLPNWLPYNQVILYPAALLALLAAGGGNRAQRLIDRLTGLVLVAPWPLVGLLVSAWAAAGALGGTSAAGTVAGLWPLTWLPGCVVPVVLLLSWGRLAAAGWGRRRPAPG